MLTPSRILHRLRYFLTRRQRVNDIDDELRFHIDMEAARLVREGISEAEARAQAERSFGGVARFRDETSDAHGVRPLEDLTQDLRVGWRGLVRQRSFSAVAILTLAIGIGGTTAVFGAVYGILIAPLPYADQERVVTIWDNNTKTGNHRAEVSPGNFLDWRERARSFAYIAAAEPWSLDYIGPDGPEQFNSSNVTAGYFQALGARPLLGRLFLDEEAAPGRNAVVIMAEALWRSRFGADPSIIGRTLVLDSIPTIVVGVMPRYFDLPYGEQMWMPKVFRDDEREDRNSAFYTAVGRLKPGVTLDAAQREMSAIAAELGRLHPASNAAIGITLVPLAETLVGGTRRALLILLGAVAFVLLIACANVANLQLTQSGRRRRELAIRAAIGAGGTRLARQLLTESLLLGVIGGAFGIAVAHWGISAIRALAPVNLPRIDELHTSPAMLLFALAISILAAVAFGLAPVTEARRLRLAETLGGGGRSATASRSRRRAHNLLVVAEIALALVLMVGAGLLMRSFASLLGVERGFHPDGVVVATMQAWGYYPTPPQRAAFVRETVARMATLPGVRSAGTSSSLPLSPPIGQSRSRVVVEGQPAVPAAELPLVHTAAISPGYLETLRVPLRSGRMIGASDNESSALVAVVNETFARRYWPGGSAIGKRLTLSFQGPSAAREIVGVVGDMRHDGLGQEPRPSIFVPHAQAPSGAAHLVVRGTGDLLALERAIRKELIAINGSMPLSGITTMETLLSDSLRERRFHLALLGGFSLTALVLAMIGIYGVVSHATAQRAQEFGVRLAMGARSGDVTRMVVGQGAVLAGIGIALGVAGAVALTRLLEGMLFQVTPLDPLTYGAAVAMLLAISVLACWQPARRAGKVDVVKVLHD
jgi:predicted permease